MISGIIDFLIEDTTVQELVGMNKHASTYKVYPVRAPQEEKRPYIVLRRIANEPLDCKTGASTDDKSRFSLIVYAETYDACEQICDACRVVLDGKKDGDYKQIWYTTAEDLFDPGDGNNGSVVINNIYKAWVSR